MKQSSSQRREMADAHFVKPAPVCKVELYLRFNGNPASGAGKLVRLPQGIRTPHPTYDCPFGDPRSATGSRPKAMQPAFMRASVEEVGERDGYKEQISASTVMAM